MDFERELAMRALARLDVVARSNVAMQRNRRRRNAALRNFYAGAVAAMEIVGDAERLDALRHAMAQIDDAPERCLLFLIVGERR